MVADRLKDAEWAGFNIVSFLDDDADNVKARSQMGAEERVRELLFALRHSTIQIRIVPNIFSFKLLLGQSISDVAGIPVVDINSSPISGMNRIIKEIEDRVLAAIINGMDPPFIFGFKLSQA
jgi:putative colanic acid biosynthesis UDP-glucose lipid carrier transferase